MAVIFPKITDFSAGDAFDGIELSRCRVVGLDKSVRTQGPKFHADRPKAQRVLRNRIAVFVG